MEKLQYSDLYEGQQVYVEYEKDGCVWSEETKIVITDGMETVFKDQKGNYYTIDKKGSKLTELEHYIEIGGIQLYKAA